MSSPVYAAGVYVSGSAVDQPALEHRGASFLAAELTELLERAALQARAQLGDVAGNPHGRYRPIAARLDLAAHFISTDSRLPVRADGNRAPGEAASMPVWAVMRGPLGTVNVCGGHGPGLACWRGRR